MKSKWLLTLFLFGPVQLQAQETPKKTYWKSASEFIFSLGSVLASSSATSDVEVKTDPIVRFSAFFHIQQQFHYDFSNSIGLFTGAGIRNVGMINDLNDSVKLKQRVYSLGIPVAVKFGNFKDDFYFSLGGEFELFFHYKQKVFHDDDKKKNSEWFSDKVNLFNPSAFVDINLPRGAYVRFKYYFMDFLVPENQHIEVNGQPYAYYPDESKLFYVAIGATIRHREMHHSNPAIQEGNSAFAF